MHSETARGSRVIFFGLCAICLVAASAVAFTEKQARDSLDLVVFQNPQLRLVEANVDVQSIRDSVPNIAAMDSFRTAHGAAWRITLDTRRGIPSLVGGGAIALLPGEANDLQWEPLAPGCRSNQCIPVAVAEQQARAFLAQWREIFPMADAELVLDADGSGPFGSSMYFLRFQWTVGGVPVERGSLYLRINRGNLIQVASERLGIVDLDAAPSLEAGQARAVVKEFLGPFGASDDTYLDKGTLRFVPVTPAGQSSESYDGEVGGGIDYRLAWRVAFERDGVVGTWEALVDAHTGELLRFVDANRYGRVHGGAYPRDGHTDEADRPFPFADIGGGEYADAGGLFDGTDATVTLVGKYTWVNDDCGAVNGSTTEGDVDFGVGPAGEQDCAVPIGNTAGAGNTHSSRTQYYHLTNVNIKARTYMPGNSWLNDGHMNVNVNQSPWCNATSGSGTLNFYKADSGCWNLGELPAVSLHEWGHSMDDFDGSGGDSPPVETRADWTAILQTHDSCVGRGFFLTGNCGGYGDPCLDCSGVRDDDWGMHESQTPWTAANQGTFWSCSGGSYYGPCGWSDHCESGISTQALWDLATRDLVDQPSGMDMTSAWQLVDRLFYTSMPTLGDMYTCSAPSSNGCNGSGLYHNFMAIDDDGDGTANGTPHAAAIFAALARHNIACGAVDDPENQSTSSCPSLDTPVVTTAAGSDSAVVSWQTITNAVRYLVYRNDIGCDAGFTKVGEVTAPATSFSDTTVVNGIEYYYRVMAVTDTDSCASALSDCVTAVPQPCAGSITLDRATYNCSDVMTISLVDSDLTGNLSQTVTVWSDTEPTPETVTLAESPADSGLFVGTIATDVNPVAGDGAVAVAHGAAITVRYHDVSYCGPAQDVDSGAIADCQAPIISGTRSEQVTGFSAEVAWETDEPATSLVTYSPVVPPARDTVGDDAFVTSHRLFLSNLAECTEYVYSVASADPAGNASTDDNGGPGFTFRTGKNTQPTYVATDTPVAIPDDDPIGATSTIAVTDDKSVLDVNVSIDISHTYDGDLNIYLVGPDGTTVTLSGRNGGGGNDFIGTIFDDEAGTDIGDGSPPFTGSFRPDEPLSTFDGFNATGDWSLKVVDEAGIDTGTIDAWSLTLLYAAETCPTSDGWVDLDAEIYGCNATITLTVQDQDLEGDGTVDVELESTTETTFEVVTLSETAPGLFEAAVATTAASAAADGQLSLATGDLITVRYMDADDGGGGHGVVKTDTANADCVGPVITDVQVVEEGGRHAVVGWTTSEPADGAVVADTVLPPTSIEAGHLDLSAAHLVRVDGLQPCTRYYFLVRSEDVHGNVAEDTAGGLYRVFETGEESQPVFESVDTPIAIPDSTPAGIQSTISVADDVAVIDVDVEINVTHTFDGDLDIWLVGPDGTQVELTTDNGSTGENFVNTVFDDEAATSIVDGSAPFTGSFRPEGLLSTLDGVNAVGDWSLLVVDDAGSDIGNLESWSLMLTYESVPCNGIPYFVDSFETGNTSAWPVVVP